MQSFHPGINNWSNQNIPCQYFLPGIHPNLDSQQITDTLKLALMIGDVRLFEEKEGVSGDIYVLDAAILGPSLLARLSPSIVKKFMICVQVMKEVDALVI